MNSQPSPISPRPAVHLHIERLVLDGLELAPAEAARFEAALTGELARHLVAVPAGSWTSAVIARRSVAPIEFHARQPAADLAAAIARSVFAGVFPAASQQPLARSPGLGRCDAESPGVGGRARQWSALRLPADGGTPCPPERQPAAVGPAAHPALAVKSPATPGGPTGTTF